MDPPKVKIISTEAEYPHVCSELSAFVPCQAQSTDELNDPFFRFVWAPFSSHFSPWVKCIWFLINFKLLFKSKLGYLVNSSYTSYM